jgi:hypothetical protein
MGDHSAEVEAAQCFGNAIDPHDARRDLQLVTEGFDTADLKDAKALLEQL